MQIAELTAQRSTCARLKVGCVIANAELTNIVSFGYNGPGRALPNGCTSETPGACGCLHAEENALIKAPYDAGPLVLFTTTLPCSNCAQRILNSRVTAVYYREWYRDPTGLGYLSRGGVEFTLLKRPEA